LARAAARSAAARQRRPGVYDLRDGVRPQQTFDLHRAVPPPTGPPPLVLFLHGGYWRALDKRDHSFVAPLFVEAGVTLVNVNYDVCPSVTLDEIVYVQRRYRSSVRNFSDVPGKPNGHALPASWSKACNPARDVCRVDGHVSGVPKHPHTFQGMEQPQRNPLTGLECECRLQLCRLAAHLRHAS